MNDQIISREQIRARARRAFEAGHSRDDDNMNLGAAALADWLAEYDRLAAQARQVAKRREVTTA
jgi:hypothetical protein